MTVPDCLEMDEIQWSDARKASEHYRTCKDLRGQRIQDLSSTVRGRWKWLKDQQVAISVDDKVIEDAAGGD